MVGRCENSRLLYPGQPARRTLVVRSNLGSPRAKMITVNGITMLPPIAAIRLNAACATMSAIPKVGVAWTITGTAVANMLFWSFRLSAFRKDRAREPRGFFGSPYDWAWEIYDPSRYTPGARWIYWIFCRVIRADIRGLGFRDCVRKALVNTSVNDVCADVGPLNSVPVIGLLT